MTERAGPEAAERLAQIHASAFDHGWSADSIAALISEGAIALATDDGFVLVRAAAGEAEILTLAVEPAFRRRGSGRELVEAAAEAVRADGAESLFLEVAADNTPARSLYRACGFEQVGVRRGYYARTGQPQADALVLRRSLEESA